ncbi:MAG: peptidylprolyl isomerase [Candidatus Riflebacteria bacterium]|nr:peptidylprolyl isomerase [Candidatus Riflebacteria bacterium]
MKNYKLLIIAAVLIVIAMLINHDGKPGTAGDPLVGKNLLTPAEIDQVRAFTLLSPEEEISVAQQNGSWRVTSRGGFAAARDRIEDLFQKLASNRIMEMVSANPARHADLGVANLAEGSRPGEDCLLLTLRDKAGKELKTLHLGKGRPSRGPDGSVGYGDAGQYLRFSGNDNIYLASERLWIDNTQLRWLNTSLLKLAAKDISRINNRPVVPENAFVLARANATSALQLAGLPEKQQTKQPVADAVAGFFADINCDDIVATDEPLQHSGLASATLIEVETFNGLTVSLRIGSEPTDLANGGKGYIVSLDASYTGTDPALAALASETSSNAAKFVYAMQEAKIKPLLVKTIELTEPRPEPPPVSVSASDTATVPPATQQVEATHILIAWQGADRSQATRSKDEARKLIESLQKKIKEGADIGTLAAENSDCPSGKSARGSLGSFGRGAMAKPFEDAAFGLKVGEVSDIVETGFGYHLIRRDK